MELTDEVAILADGTSRAASSSQYIADAIHVALASYHKIDYLVTWNFGHLANVRRKARIRLFNTAAGFYVPMIVTRVSGSELLRLQNDLPILRHPASDVKMQKARSKI